MLSAPLDGPQEFHGVEAIIAVAIAHAVQSTLIPVALVDHHIKTVERPEQAVSLAERHADLLDRDLPGRASFCWERDAVKAAELVRDNQSSFGIDGHIDP
jgi:hypothetical protein